TFEGSEHLYVNEGPVLQTTASWVSYNSDAIMSIAWGDVDGDGDLDLAVGSGFGSPDKQAGAAVYANEGGVLQTSPIWTPDGQYYDDGVYYASVSDLAWGDLDGDGDLDLAVSGDPIKVYANQDGMLQTRAIWSSTDGGGSLAWGDVYGDGDLDLATSGGLYANENGVLQTNPSWAPADAAFDIAWGDVDGDGDLDLATSNGWRAGASVYINAD
ncbi:MAG: VCBS repeat-containing protein, partial [Planctomycetales bacterium]|nr:VCBS repeat-containing protein [Planctomycetales bacterium]